jgi:hypothetical protein
MSSAAADMPASPASAKPLGLCLSCNYPLWGLSTPRCPECGREFDPLDPATMNMGRELTALAKWVLGPIRWPVSVLTWGALVYSLWSARLPGGQIRASVSLYILIGLGILWLAWPLVRVIAAREYGWPHSLLMRGQKQRVAVGLCLLVGATAIVLGLPLRGALWISKPAMDHLANDTIHANRNWQDNRRVGVFYARRVKQTPGGGMRFTVEEAANGAYRAGFTYLPNLDPKRVGSSQKNFRYLGNSWWAWREEG